MTKQPSGHSGIPRTGFRFRAPDLFASLVFLLIFSGPPRFRIRDPQATLAGEIDLAAMTAVVVWIVAGLWVAYQVFALQLGKRPPLNLRLTQKLGIALLLALGTSTSVSLSPELTLFKVYQMLVLFLFTLIFIEWYGMQRFLDRLLVCSAVLCSAVVAAIFIAPDLVLFTSETGFPRLRGEGITDAGTLACLGTILLFTSNRRIPIYVFAPLAALFGGVLFFSLARIGWLAATVFFFIALWKRPAIRTMKWIYLFWILAVAALVGGAASLIGELRDPSSVSDLSGRFGLWAYYISVTWLKSPWLGLGYVAGTREVGAQYDPLLGSGHSILFDVFVGGGLVSLSVFVLLIVVLLMHAIQILRKADDSCSFAVGSLMIAAIILGSVGSDIDSSPFGFTFWALVTLLPLTHYRIGKSIRSPRRGRKSVARSPALPSQPNRQISTT